MKFRITMKDPDGVQDALREATEESLKDMKGLSRDEAASLYEARHESITESLRPWFEYSEYLTVEIDTEANTCVIIKNQ